MIRLGVNIDHVATVRNARGGAHPDPVRAALAAAEAGADGITAHLREDRRHITDDDIKRLCEEISVPLNLEMAATDDMITLACHLKPRACCIVPERRAELTTEGGLDVCRQEAVLAGKVARLRGAGLRVSLFVDPSVTQIKASARVGAQVVELHTGAYARDPSAERLGELSDAADEAAAQALELHAGHGLTFDNVGPVAQLRGLRELNIGHFLVGEALFIGFPNAIRHMKQAIAAGAPSTTEAG